MIALFTDFGPGDVYVGQVHAVLAHRVPRVPVIDLLHDVPAGSIEAASWLLAALCRQLPGDTVVVAVVDPGVGGERDPVMVKLGDRWFVGPDNGLLNVAAADEAAEWFRIDWRPEMLSDTFHGRDLFAPVAAMLVEGHLPVATGIDSPVSGIEEGAGLSEIIYVDHYGNAMTGLAAATHGDDAVFRLGRRHARYARCYEEAPAGKLFWYRNSIGLVEFALAGGSASETFDISVGQRVFVVA